MRPAGYELGEREEPRDRRRLGDEAVEATCSIECATDRILKPPHLVAGIGVLLVARYRRSA